MHELYYETHNNMARCMNFSGDIEKSLEYLLLAFKNVEKLTRDQEPGSVTIIPELSLNICNAMIYLKNFNDALDYADQAVKSSKACINSLHTKLDHLDQSGVDGKSEYQRLYQLFFSQINLHIQGF